MNDDGVGFAYVDPEKKQLVIDKGFMHVGKALEAIQAKEDLEMLIHFRRISRGEKSEANCHPFGFNAWYCDDNWEYDTEGKNPRFSFAVVHNGTLPFWSTAKESDTRCWVDNILAPELDINPWMIDRPSGRWFIKESIGSNNKIAIMRYDNMEHKLVTVIINEDGISANKSHGCWFSNYSWVPLTTYQGHNGGGYGSGAPFCRGGRAFGGHIHAPVSPVNGAKQHTPNPTVTNANTDGELYPDHMGWQWKKSLNKFINVERKTEIDALSYRNPMENDYLYEGKWYQRFKPIGGSVKQKVLPLQTTVPKLHLLEGPKEGSEDNPIEVPRDIDSGPEDDFEKDLKLAKALSECDVSHLNKREKRELRRCAGDWFRAQFGEVEYKTTSYPMMITMLRDWWRQEFPICKDINDIKVLDLRIINSGGVNEKPKRQPEGFVNQGGYGFGFGD